MRCHFYCFGCYRHPKPFVGFLSALGTFLPPIGAVLAVDYYLLKKKHQYDFENMDQTTSYKPLAFVSVVLGGGNCIYFPKSGSTTITAIILTARSVLWLK